MRYVSRAFSLSLSLSLSLVRAPYAVSGYFFPLFCSPPSQIAHSAPRGLREPTTGCTSRLRAVRNVHMTPPPTTTHSVPKPQPVFTALPVGVSRGPFLSAGTKPNLAWRWLRTLPVALQCGRRSRSSRALWREVPNCAGYSPLRDFRELDTKKVGIVCL